MHNSGDENLYIMLVDNIPKLRYNYYIKKSKAVAYFISRSVEPSANGLTEQEERAEYKRGRDNIADCII